MSKQIDLLRHATEQLEAVWRSGHTPNIREIVDSFLCDNPVTRGLRKQMFYELIRVDLEHRWRDVGETTSFRTGARRITPAETTVPRPRQQSLEEYLTAIPDISFDKNELLELIKHEFLVRYRSGDIAEMDEYARRFSHMGDLVRERLADLSHELMLESSIRSLLRDDDPLIEETSSLRGVGEASQASCSQHEPTIDRQALAETLKLVSPFTALSKFVRYALAQKLTPQPFDTGDVLLRQGDAADSLLIVLQGAVEVTVQDQGRSHLIARLGPHTVIGEIGLLTGGLRSANVVAATGGIAGTIARADFEWLAGQYPRLSVALSELIAERVGTLTIDVLCGKTIDQYDIRQRLGRGAMGIVYEAWDRTGSQPVALKMLRHDLAFDNIATERFHQEAEIVKHLDHVNIIRTYREFSAFGTSFIAMELCNGPSLAELIDDAGHLSPSQARALIGQIAMGLACAHRAGIAHRDLKPSNVMLAPDGTAKLADFGLARSITMSDAGLTSYGHVVGTPRYMAPEQLAGDRGNFKSDLFSFGCIAFELVSGRPLFQSGYFKDLLGERQAWSLPGPEEICKDLDTDLYLLLRQCLALDPHQRAIDLAEIGKWAAPVDASKLLDSRMPTRSSPPPPNWTTIVLKGTSAD